MAPKAQKDPFEQHCGCLVGTIEPPGPPIILRVSDTAKKYISSERNQRGAGEKLAEGSEAIDYQAGKDRDQVVTTNYADSTVEPAPTLGLCGSSVWLISTVCPAWWPQTQRGHYWMYCVFYIQEIKRRSNIIVSRPLPSKSSMTLEEGGCHVTRPASSPQAVCPMSMTPLPSKLHETSNPGPHRSVLIECRYSFRVCRMDEQFLRIK
ncbi:hypothetical protein P7K49_018564 [Saguinus oedipus]|uniref:Uncharacterized protein n=1 Tax=Saguinus oedipus TaxID=9490 RepID=A0ABQ9V7R6_SAGOE|nr:hypothetical protein P7K49_018564 [Saguinus oedipus]